MSSIGEREKYDILPCSTYLCLTIFNAGIGHFYVYWNWNGCSGGVCPGDLMIVFLYLRQQAVSSRNAVV